MKNKNVYKPRYKIAYQAKKKNWIYKNCRMRRFFNIRGRKIQRKGQFKRIVLVFNNIKWTVARRYIKPYRHKRRSGLNKKRYRLRFYTKQLVRNFYGKMKESVFQQFLRSYLLSVKRRNNSFFAALERRLDMVVFRMRFLPTIFACNQLVFHYGVSVNNQIERAPSSLISIGDTVTLAKDYWDAVFVRLNILLVNRCIGLSFVGRRQYKAILKKIWILKKIKHFASKDFLMLRKKFKVFSYIKFFKTMFRDKNEEEEENNIFGSKFLNDSSKKIYKSKSKEVLIDDNSSFWLGLSEHLTVEKKKNLKKNEKENDIGNETGILTLKLKENLVERKKVNSEREYLDKILNIKYKDILSKESIERIKVLFEKIYKVFKRSKKTLNKYISKKKKKRKKHLRKWRWKKNYSFFFKMMTFNFKFAKSLNYLWLRLRLEEIRNYRNLIVNLYIKRKKENILINRYNEVQDTKEYQSLIKILRNHESLVKKEYTYISKTLLIQYRHMLKKKIRRKLKKGFKKRAKKRLFKYMLRKKRKKKRALWSKRLKGYHWFLPSYLEFDWKTMTGILIKTPTNKETYLPFRCTLRQIYSFYRSRGY